MPIIKAWGGDSYLKADFELLQSLALTTQGDYFRAYQEADMDRVFTRIQRSLEDFNEEPASASPLRLRTKSRISEQVAGGESPAFVTLELIGQEDESARNHSYPHPFEA